MWTYFVSIESIAPYKGFTIHMLQICSYCFNRVFTLFESA